MEMSTIIVLAIAIFIIIYRIKTWNDVNVLDKKSKIVEEVVEYKVDEPTVTAVKATKAKPKAAAKKPKKDATPAKKATAAKSTAYKKTLKADLSKNQVLAQAVSNSLGDQLVLEIKSQPKSGVTTLITLAPSFCKDDRAVGLVYEKTKASMTIIKSFDVKIQANGQFKIATTFSKSLAVKKDDMATQSVVATQLFVSDDKSVDVADVVVTLK